MLITSLGQTNPCIDRLSDIVEKNLLRAASPFRSVGGDHCQVPRLHFAVGILRIHVKIRVWVLPGDAREGTLQIQAVIYVKLYAESVMREHGNGRANNQDSHQYTLKFHSHEASPSTVVRFSLLFLSAVNCNQIHQLP